MRRFLAAPPFSTGGLLLAASLLGACTGGDGDPPSRPAANELGTCGRLAQTVGAATWVDADDATSASCSALPLARSVCLSGLTIAAIDTFDETKDSKSSGNYYVEDTSSAPPPYSGITIYRPSFSPPALRLAEGDVVDFLGSYTEFNGPPTFKFSHCRTLPELSGALSFRFDNNVPITPKKIAVGDLTSYATGRPHLGTLVTVEDITLDGKGAGGTKGRYAAGLDVGTLPDPADMPSVTNELFDMEHEGPPMPAKAHFKSITGIVTYFASFHIAPRSAADLEP